MREAQRTHFTRKGWGGGKLASPYLYYIIILLLNIFDAAAWQHPQGTENVFAKEAGSAKNPSDHVSELEIAISSEICHEWRLITSIMCEYSNLQRQSLLRSDSGGAQPTTAPKQRDMGERGW